MGRYISEEVVEEFQKNGVVFLQGFFSNHWLNLLRVGIKKNLNEPGPNQHYKIGVTILTNDHIEKLAP